MKVEACFPQLGDNFAENTVKKTVKTPAKFSVLKLKGC